MRFKNEHLLSLRREKGMSREALAKASGVSEQAIWKIESGRSKSPEMPTITALASTLGSPAESFFDFGTHLNEQETA